jgi:hypothetical protein
VTAPPSSRIQDRDLTYDGRPPVPLEGPTGAVALFVSDAWHAGNITESTKPGQGDSWSTRSQLQTSLP